MTPTGTRLATFGGSSIRVEHSGHLAGEMINFLFGHTGADARVPTSATFQVELSPIGTWTIQRNGCPYYQGDGMPDAARALIEAASFSLADRSVGGLLFHAAAVSRRDRVVLIPGQTGAGKTTLAGRLVDRGLRYLTDELSYVPDESVSVLGFPRPLNVKPSGRDLLAHRVDGALRWPSLVSHTTALLHPLAARRSRQSRASRLTVIVFPRRQRTAAPRLVPLDPGRAALRLMGSLLNARNLPDHGFPAVVELARRIPAFEAIYEEVEQVERSIEDLDITSRRRGR